MYLMGHAAAGVILVLLAGAGLAEDMKPVDGHSVSVIDDGAGVVTLIVDGAVVHENGVIYLDAEPVVVGGIAVVTGAAGAGGNACNAAPFVLALPEGGAPAFWGPVDSCAYFTPKVEGGQLIFTAEPMPGAAGETWVWSRDGGFVPGPAVGFVPNAGWEALDSLAGAHPADALAIAPVTEALQAGMGADYPMFLERITGLGSGDLTATGYQGEACIKLTCEADWAILYLDRATRQPFAIWHVYGQIENRIFPQDTTQWPPEAMALLRDRAGD
jgi:hypothetical protein